MSINIKNERTISGLEFEMAGLTPEEAKRLRDYGWEQIQKDDDALINYGFMHYMKEFTTDLEKNIQFLKQKLATKQKRLDVTAKKC